jgi:hypothetical protein
VAVLGADVQDPQHVGVVEPAGGARLELEAAEAVGVASELRRQNLDRHVAPQPRVARAEDFPHAADAHRREDLVGAEPRALADARHEGPGSGRPCVCIRGVRPGL